MKRKKLLRTMGGGKQEGKEEKRECAGGERNRDLNPLKAEKKSEEGL